MKKVTFIAVMLLLVSAYLISGSARDSKAAVAQESMSRNAEPPTVRVIFRGSMVFHYDKETGLLEVGVLPAQDHEFKMAVKRSSPTGEATVSIPVGQQLPSKGNIWRLEYSE